MPDKPLKPPRKKAADLALATSSSSSSSSAASTATSVPVPAAPVSSSASSSSASAAPGSAIDRLQEHNAQVKPTKPASLTAQQKLTKFQGSSFGDQHEQGWANKMSADILKNKPDGRTPTAMSTDLATKILAMAHAEKDTIRADVLGVIADGGGQRGGGDRFMMKDAVGLAGKIAGDLAEKGLGGTDPETLAKIGKLDVGEVVGDALRFTAIFRGDGTFVKTANAAMATLESLGYQRMKLSNTFLKDDPTYLGINTTWRAKGTGVKWELQFHTDDSWLTKQEKNHFPYEAARLLPENDPRLPLLNQAMQKNSRQVARPAGMTSLGDTSGVEAPEKALENPETRQRRSAADSRNQQQPRANSIEFRSSSSSSGH